MLANIPTGNFTVTFDNSTDGMNVLINHGFVPVLNHLQSIGIAVKEQDIFHTYLNEVGYQVFDYRHFGTDSLRFYHTVGSDAFPDLTKFSYLQSLCPANVVKTFTEAVKYFAIQQYQYLQAQGAIQIAIQGGHLLIFDSMSLHHITLLYGEQ